MVRLEVRAAAAAYLHSRGSDGEHSHERVSRHSNLSEMRASCACFRADRGVSNNHRLCVHVLACAGWLCLTPYQTGRFTHL